MSATVLILASIDRLLISSQNVETRLYSSKRLAYLLIGTSTIFWSIFFLHVSIRFNVEKIDPFISICTPGTNDPYKDFLNYSMVTINVVSFLMMVILSILSFKNVRRIRSIPRQQRQTGRTMRKKDFQLLRCLFAKDLIYIIFNAYQCAYFLYKLDLKSRPQTDSERELDTFIFTLGAAIQFIPSCVGFFVYLIISRAFRQRCQRALWKNAIREEEPNEQEIGENRNELVVVSTIAT